MSFLFNNRLGNDLDTSEIQFFRRPFRNFDLFYPSKGAAKADPVGSISMSFLSNNSVGNDFDTFKNTIFRRPQKNLENVLSPEGSCESSTLWGPFDVFFI